MPNVVACVFTRRCKRTLGSETVAKSYLTFSMFSSTSSPKAAASFLLEVMRGNLRQSFAVLTSLASYRQ